LATAA